MSGTDCLSPAKDVAKVMADTKLPTNKIDMEKFKRHDFDPFEFSLPELASAAASVFCDNFASLKLDSEVVRAFTTRVLCAGMRDVPFHNGYHACGVFQTLWAYLSNSSGDPIVAKLTPIEKFSALVAAICHDLDHPGLTNTFLINAKNPLAAKYNNTSVLENHHLAQARVILADSKYNLRAPLSTSDNELFEKVLEDCIGATDLAKQKDTLAVLSEMVSRGVDMNKPNDRLYVLIGLVKCSDVSNETKATPLNRKWADRVNAEFFAQGDVEKERGMESLPMMDRTAAQADPEAALAKSQMGFIQFVCAPLYDQMEKVLPTAMKETCSNLRANLDMYKSKTS